ncbi:3087_t:CDS:2 [Diversispora eburnea]|uniref:3087_t:CDS:1 n=1 Tax=Diversispora eburnea TaxID=1213867 RepID=A0A9N8VI42_9GLOM|nr:3087_t:CDS:2 [Diversispora eburnea]
MLAWEHHCDFLSFKAYDDGKSKVLLCLHGTIPITYLSTLYNIPVDFWIPTEYPKVPPIAFVVPTSSMLVRPSRNVDVSGRCYHPYLHQWSTQSNDPNASSKKVINSRPRSLSGTSSSNQRYNMIPSTTVYDKVKSCCNEYLERSVPELHRIMAIEEDLSKSQELIRQEKFNLIELEKVLDNKLNFVKMKITEIDKLIEQAKNIPEVSVDDILSEDNATEDAIYYLGKALSTERIDLNTYMKSIRTLAREQFMHRALIGKIRRQTMLNKS